MTQVKNKKINVLTAIALFFVFLGLASTLYMICKNEENTTPMIITSLSLLGAAVPYIILLEIERKRLGIVFFYSSKKKE